jgi:large subunit ribosomal protein L3
MLGGLIAKKIGMTQLFREDGRVVPATVLHSSCVVVQRKTRERDGYEAAQVGLVETKPPKHPNKPTAGHFKNAGVPPTRILREFAIQDGADPKPGDTVACTLFKAGDKVDVVGTSRGHGFQGVMKRHNFRGGAASHGSMFHRAPGSIGASAWPSRVMRGMKMAGQMGNKRITVKGLEIVEVDEARNLILIRGAVPGTDGAIVVIRFQQPKSPAKGA